VSKAVAICDSQPVAVEGLRAVLASCEGLTFAWAAHSITEAVERMAQVRPGVLVLDKAFGIQAVTACLNLVRVKGWETATVVWGVSITDAEALRFLQAGTKGVLRKTEDLQTLRDCLLAAASGATWVRPQSPRPRAAKGPPLTQREQQVLDLIGQGMKNREIAAELGIRPGTVKVHLKHIFEKTGVRSRYGLALTGWNEGLRLGA